VVLEARGFIFSGAFKNITNVKIVMARKPGKLPTDQVHSIAYTKEYGTDEICIAKDAIPPNSHVLLVDDVYATGNTMRAVETLVTTHFQSKVVAFVAPFAIETEPGKLLAKGQLAKVRYAQTQLLLPEWEAQALEEDDDDNTICIIPPSLHTFSPNKRAVVVWKQFSASSNITFNGQELENKKVVLYLNVRDQSELYEVLSLLSILYRKQPRSIKIILPFLEQGTQGNCCVCW
jgi:adenine phosphoribosyltransferase